MGGTHITDAAGNEIPVREIEIYLDCFKQPEVRLTLAAIDLDLEIAEQFVERICECASLEWLPEHYQLEHHPDCRKPNRL